MAGVLQKAKSWRCPRTSVVLFSLFCFLEEWKSTTALVTSQTVTYNVLHISKPRPQPSHRSIPQQRLGSEAGAAWNASQKFTAHAKVIHRSSVSHRGDEISREELLRETMRRDEARVRAIQNNINREVRDSKTQLQDFQAPMSSGLRFGAGEYLAVLGVGTPPRSMYFDVDTGSDITWLQCSPCRNCYKQKDALFNPSNSSTYQALRCDDALCLNLDVMGCVSNKCLYQADYGDGSFTSGDLATENVILDAAAGSSGEVVTLTNIPMGCGHDNEGMFGMAAGILGLGFGPLSFPNQIDVHGGVFSYCLPDRESDRHSSLIFGDAAIPDHAPGAVMFTPQLRNPRVATYYYVQITGISVGGNVLTAIPATAFLLDLHGYGGTILDSGTTVSRLQAAAYSAVRDAFRSATQHLKVAGAVDFLDTCFDLTGLASVSVPTVTFHFQGGYDMRLPPSNYLIPVNSNDTFCLAFAGTGGPSIFGNVQQQGFRVVHDNAHMRIGFLPDQC